LSRTIVPYPDVEIQFVGEKAARQFMPEKISHHGYHIDKIVCDGIWGICKRYLHNGISYLEAIWIFNLFNKGADSLVTGQVTVNLHIPDIDQLLEGISISRIVFSIFSSPPYIVIVTRNFLSYSGNYHRQKNRQNALCVLSIVFTYENLLSSKLTSKAPSTPAISFSSSFPRYCIILCLSIVLSCSKSTMEG